MTFECLFLIFKCHWIREKKKKNQEKKERLIKKKFKLNLFYVDFRKQLRWRKVFGTVKRGKWSEEIVTFVTRFLVCFRVKIKDWDDTTMTTSPQSEKEKIKLIKNLSEKKKKNSQHLFDR